MTRNGGVAYPGFMATLAIAHRDTELMLRVQTGDESSFALLLDHYRAPLLRFLYRMTQDLAIAEELAQDVFLRVYRSRATYQPTAKFSTWLFCIATRLALNWRRDVRKERGHESLDGALPARELSDRRPTIERTLVYRTRVEEIRRAIDGLPAKQRAAVVLHKYHDMDYPQIGRTLGSSESAVKSLLFRAYESLRKRLIHLAPAARLLKAG